MKKDILNDNQLNKKISVFHLNHYGAIAQAITLRTRLHPDDYAVLVVENYGDKAKYEVLQKLVLNGVFDKLIFCIIPNFIQINNEDVLKEKICEFFDNEFKGIDFDNIGKIYTSCDIFNIFEIWLSMKKYEYIYYECAPTVDKRFKKIDFVFKSNACSKEFNDIMNKYKISSGFSDLCVGYMIFKESKINPFIDSSKIIVYDFNKELTLIDENFKEKIVAAFEIDRIADDSQLILTNSGVMMRNAKQLSVKQRPLLIQYLIDFTRGVTKPVIKPHPFDNIDYTNFNVSTISYLINIELLNLTGGLKNLSKTVSINSSANRKLDLDNSCEQIEWGFEYFHQFQSIPILYAVAGLLSSINVRGRNYHMIGENNKWVKSFYMCSKYNISKIRGASPKRIGDAIVFVDSSDTNVKSNIKIGLESAHNDGIVCFLNMKTQLTDYDIPINILNEIIPFKINVDADEGSFDTSREHTVYFFTKNPEIRKKIQSFSMSEYFKYSKTKVTVDLISNLRSQIDFLKLIIGNFI